MKDELKHFTILGLAIVVMSSSGTLGSYITLPPPLIIWIRCFIGAGALFLFLKLSRTPTFIGWGKNFRIIALSSVALAIHWVTYFYSLSLSNVAVGMLSLFVYPVFTALLEPIFFKTKIHIVSVLLALFALSGVYFLIPEFDLDNSITMGVAVGVFSGFMYVVRNLLLKMNISELSGSTVMYYQLWIIAILLSPVLLYFNDQQVVSLAFDQWEALLILAVVTTATAHTLFVVSLDNFSVTTVSIISNATPLFGILLGFLFLGQVPDQRAYIGGGIIMLSVMIESVRALRSG